MKKQAKTVSISLSVAMIFVTVFALVSLTYSWYNKASAADITSINMSAIGSAGIQLSGNGVDWKSVLSASGVSPDISIDQELLFDSISSPGTVVNGNLQFYTGQFGENGFTTTLHTGSPLYYSFDFYILNNDELGKKLTLGYNSSVVDTNNKDVAYTMRVGFIKLGHSSVISEVIALDGQGINAVDYIWEPNSTIRNKRVGLYRTTFIPEGKTTYNAINRAASNLTLQNSLVIDSPGTPEAEVVEVITNDPIGSGDANEITLLASSSITKIRIFIWSEGQDIDSTNSTSSGTASVNLNFNTYDVQDIEGQLVPVEKFDATVIINDSGASYIWDAASTNLSESTYASMYIFRISKYISGTLTTIRTVSALSTTLDVDELEDLELGQYYVKLKAHSVGYCDSEFSNILNFYVLTRPLNISIASSVLSWSAVENAASYTIQALDEQTGISYTATTTSLSLNLETTLFSGYTYLSSGKVYKISIKSNGNLGYANSKYSTTLNWLY